MSLFRAVVIRRGISQAIPFNVARLCGLEQCDRARLEGRLRREGMRKSKAMCFKGVGGRRVSRGVGDIRTKAACRNIPALALGRAESIAPSTAETSGWRSITCRMRTPSSRGDSRTGEGRTQPSKGNAPRRLQRTLRFHEPRTNATSFGPTCALTSHALRAHESCHPFGVQRRKPAGFHPMWDAMAAGRAMACRNCRNRWEIRDCQDFLARR